MQILQKAYNAGSHGPGLPWVVIRQPFSRILKNPPPALKRGVAPITQTR